MIQDQKAGGTMSARRPLMLLVAMVLLAGAAFIAPGFSSATFTAATANAVSAVSASTDWVAPAVAVTSPGAAVRGTVTVAASASDTGSGVRDVTIQVKAAAASSWTTLCVDSSAPFSCSWNTAALADGSYDLRAIAVDKAANTATSTVVRTIVANTATVTLTNPGAVVRGSVPLQAAVVGIGTLGHSVAIEVRPAGSTAAWSVVCANLASPYSCAWNTAAATSGPYEMRAVLTAGPLTFTSALVSRVVVDNTDPTVTMTDPGTSLTGVRTFAATAADAHTAVVKVDIQAQRSGTTEWTTLCTVTASPWSCTYATTRLANGTYSFRAVAMDAAGNTATSAAFTGRTISNAPPRGHDVQAFNGAQSSPGLMGTSDVLEYTFSTEVQLGTILAGWDGSATSVQVRAEDGGFFAANQDTIEVSAGSGAVHLGVINTRGDYIRWLLGGVTFTSTMTAGTVEIDGILRTRVTIAFGASSFAADTRLTEVFGSPVMEWTPSSSVKDLLGQSVATTKTFESGPADRDF